MGAAQVLDAGGLPGALVCSSRGSPLLRQVSVGWLQKQSPHLPPWPDTLHGTHSSQPRQTLSTFLHRWLIRGPLRTFSLTHSTWTQILQLLHIGRRASRHPGDPRQCQGRRREGMQHLCRALEALHPPLFPVLLGAALLVPRPSPLLL